MSRAALAYCSTLESALAFGPGSLYVTKVILSGRVGINHVVLGSALLQVNHNTLGKLSVQ